MTTSLVFFSSPKLFSCIPVILQAIMREFDSRYIDGILDGGGRYQLDVDVNSIGFTHHHLFSREHVLANRLSQLYGQYTSRHNKNMVHFLTNKVVNILTTVHYSTPPNTAKTQSTSSQTRQQTFSLQYSTLQYTSQHSKNTVHFLMDKVVNILSTVQYTTVHLPTQQKHSPFPHRQGREHSHYSTLQYTSQHSKNTVHFLTDKAANILTAQLTVTPQCIENIVHFLTKKGSEHSYSSPHSLPLCTVKNVFCCVPE